MCGGARGGDEFRGMFLNVCARAVERGGMGEHECYALSRLVCVVASEEGDEGATAKALETLARLRARGARAFSSKAFRRYASARGGGEVIDAYVKLVKATGGSNPVVCALVNDAFVERRASARGRRRDEERALRGVLFGRARRRRQGGQGGCDECDVCVGVGRRHERRVEGCVDPESHSTVAEKSRRHCPAVVGCFKTLRGDLSEACGEMGPVILPLVKHANEERRAMSLEIIDALVAKSSDASLVKEHFFKPCADAFTTGMKPKEWTARAGLYAAIKTCTNLTDRRARETMSLEAISVLTNELKTEKQSDAKTIALDALQTWLQHTGECPESLCSLVKEITKDAKERGAILQCVAQAFRANAALPAGLSAQSKRCPRSPSRVAARRRCVPKA